MILKTSVLYYFDIHKMFICYYSDKDVYFN